jgi:RNA polymerase sigma-70 factor (ECF subfamily)
MSGAIQAALTADTADKAPEISDQVLVRSIAEGDKTALKLLYLRHRTRVYRFIVRLTGSESTADEVVHEVFMAAWRDAGQFEGKAQVATWLLAIARFKTLSHCRRRTEAPLDQQAAAPIEDPAESPAALMEISQRSDILRKCIGMLAPIHREVINLVYYQEKKLEEAANTTGVPVATVKTRLHYARSHMAKLLAEAGVDRSWVAL